MAASVAQIAQIRRMVAEPSTTTYSDATLAGYIETYPLIDSDGLEPTDDEWTDTYDLAAAAGDVWAEKASALVGGYDFDADGGSFKRSQAYDQAQKQARYWRARRTPKSMRLHVAHDFERDYQATPESVAGYEVLEGYVANMVDDDEDDGVE